MGRRTVFRTAHMISAITTPLFTVIPLKAFCCSHLPQLAYKSRIPATGRSKRWPGAFIPPTNTSHSHRWRDDSGSRAKSVLRPGGPKTRNRIIGGRTPDSEVLPTGSLGSYSRSSCHRPRFPNPSIATPLLDITSDSLIIGVF
jgi:hypothetical protein